MGQTRPEDRGRKRTLLAGDTAGGGGDTLVEELALHCLEQDDPAAALAKLNAAHPPDVVARVGRVVDRLAESWAFLGEEGAVPRPVVLAEGDSFGPFELRECLGRGGMGAVWRAVDQRLGREVALKQIHAHHFQSVPLRVRFEREARAASRLDHPNLCTVFEHGEIDGTPFLAMQLVAGESLAARVRAAADGRQALLPGMTQRAAGTGPCLVRARDDLDRLLLFAAVLADAMHHAHQQGLVHRDIKPANVMVTGDGAPVVLDFGLVRDAAVEHSLTMSGDVLGTPHYMAPEQISGSTAVDARTDVYALGATLYELLALRPPFEGDSLAALQRAITAGRPAPLRRLNSAVTPELAVVVATAMEVDPARRYPTAAALAEDLRRIVQRVPIAARPAPWWLRTLRWTQRNPVAATLLVAVSTGLLVTAWLLAETSAARDDSRANLERFHLMGSVRRLQRAESAAAALYPPLPAQVGPMKAWFAEYLEPLREDLEAVRNGRESLAALLEGDRDAAAVAGAGFDTDSARFLLESLDDHLPRLEGFLGEEGTAADVQARLAWAEQIEQRSLVDHREAWQAAVAAVNAADGVTAHAAYRGVALTPQVGLVPIGMDPASRLWEFLDLHSGDGRVPARDPDTGRLEVDEHTGVVFVLLPGGTFHMGSQADDPAGQNYDPHSLEEEWPVHAVTLAPFFLSKYELTQAQWQRLDRVAAPSRFQPSDGLGITRRNPVENVSGTQARALCAREGWVLPTEAQWEYACRAGEAAPWPWGEDGDAAAEHTNLADPSFYAADGRPEAGRSLTFDLLLFRLQISTEGVDDGYPYHAPVGSFAANRFGLHDMVGNVREWTSDWWVGHYRGPVAPDTGARVADEQRFMVSRGGAFRHPPRDARSARRTGGVPGMQMFFLGLRPARGLTLSSTDG